MLRVNVATIVCDADGVRWEVEIVSVGVVIGDEVG